jgi:hypothetical protein
VSVSLSLCDSALGEQVDFGAFGGHGELHWRKHKEVQRAKSKSHSVLSCMP